MFIQLKLMLQVFLASSQVRFLDTPGNRKRLFR